jgi:hypothetical protein
MVWGNDMKKSIFLVVTMLASSLVASPILYSSADWGDSIASGVSPISDPPDPATVINSALPSGLTGATINFTGNGLGPAVRLGDTGSAFTGDFASIGPNNLVVNFTVMSLDVVPNSLNLYFKSGANVWNSNVILDLTGMTVGVASSYSIFIGAASAWYQYAGASTFSDSFEAVSEFGFELVGGNYALAQRYEISDVYFSVPEPETVWMILVVLISLGITFRMRLMELGKQALARIKA